MLRGLTTNEVRAVATSLAHMEKIHWLVWKEHWELWKSLPDVEELMAPMNRPIRVKIPDVTDYQSVNDLDDSHPSVNRETLSSLGKPNGYAKTTKRIGDITMTDAEMDLDLEVFDASSSKSRQKDFIARNFNRYKRSLKVVIQGPGEQVFETTTLDVSVGGLLLKDSLPGWAIGRLQVRLIDKAKRQAIEVSCQVLDGQVAGQRFRMSILPLRRTEEEAHFDKWLRAG